jgi:hypothetical protein
VTGKAMHTGEQRAIGTIHTMNGSEQRPILDEAPSVSPDSCYLDVEPTFSRGSSIRYGLLI